MVENFIDILEENDFINAIENIKIRNSLLEKVNCYIERAFVDLLKVDTDYKWYESTLDSFLLIVDLRIIEHRFGIKINKHIYNRQRELNKFK